MLQQVPAAQAIEAAKNQLTRALADLATLDEQREKVKDQINALRNYVGGVSLGQREAAERARAEAEAAKASDDAPNRND